MQSTDTQGVKMTGFVFDKTPADIYVRRSFVF